MILRPKLIAIDSSHWAQWISDSASGNLLRRDAAAAFQAALLEGGYTVLFTMHHLSELLAVEDDALAAQRLRFVQGLPFLSWIGLVGSDERVLGTVADIMAAEVKAVLRGIKPEDVPGAASCDLLRSGAGYEPIPDHPDFLPFVQSWSREHAQEARTAMALEGWEAIPEDLPVRNLMSGEMRAPEEVNRAVLAQAKSLVAEIEAHGDRRIEDAPARALRFLRDMLEMRAVLPNSARELVLASYALQGIDAHEIQPEMTIRELGELGAFRGQLRVVADKLGRDFEEIKSKIRPEDLPHRVVMEAIRMHRAHRHRREGGDLNDRYFAGLSVYSDIVLTDKRTYEDFKRARRKVPNLTQFCGRVEKAPRYTDIIAEL